jgi:hypothetical protein
MLTQLLNLVKDGTLEAVILDEGHVVCRKSSLSKAATPVAQTSVAATNGAQLKKRKKRNGHFIDEATKAQAIALIKEGKLSQSKIAEKLKISTATIYKLSQAAKAK